MLANDDENFAEKTDLQEAIRSDLVKTAHNPNSVDEFHEEKPFCRLCYDTKYDDSTLIEPCLCKGTMSKVHKKCLEKWLNRIGSKKCELCLFEFKTEEILRYGMFQSIGVWTRSYRRRQYLMHDFCLFLMLNVITLSMIGLLLQAIHHIISENFLAPTLPMWYFIILCLAAGLWIVIYVSIFIIFINTHIRPWFVWWRSMKKINLLAKQ